MKTVNRVLAVSLTLGAVAMNAKDSFREAPEKYWDFEKLKDAPMFRDAPFADSQVKGLRAVLITGYGPAADEKNFIRSPKPLSAKIKTEFFAYIGFPEGPVPTGGFPGIVLIHGGGGTAYPQYTQFWMKHGYAVIAMDWYNQRPAPPRKAHGNKCETIPPAGRETSGSCVQCRQYGFGSFPASFAEKCQS